MARPLGLRQVRLLMMVASPTIVLCTTDAVSRSLTRRGCLTDDQRRITSSGLRALADAMDAGLVDRVLEAMRAKASQRSAA